MSSSPQPSSVPSAAPASSVPPVRAADQQPSDFKVYKPVDRQLVLPDSPPDLEPTAAELRSIQAALSARTQALVNAPLKVRAQREAEARARLNRWPETTLRIKFLDKTQLEKVFPSTVKIRSVYAFVRSCLNEDTKPIKFVLYQPPSRELKVSDLKVRDLTLAELQLAPASVLLVRFEDDKLNHVHTPAPLSPFVLDQAIDFPVPSPSTEEKAKAVSPPKEEVVQASSSKASTSKEEKIAKWLKLGIDPLRNFMPPGPAVRLRTSLGLEDDNAVFRLFSASIRQLCQSNIDISLRPSCIPNKTLKAIFVKAKEAYPKLLNDIDDLDSDIRGDFKDYILSMHAHHRTCFSTIKNILPAEFVSNAAVQVKKREETPENRKLDSPIPVPVPETPSLVSKQAGPSHLKRPHQHPHPDETRQHKRARIDIPSPSPKPAIIVVKTEHMPSTPLSSNRKGKATESSKEKIVDLCAIEDFLQAARPTLERFLPHFLDAGLHTEEDLRGISEWEEKEIIDFFLTSTRQFDAKMTTIDIFRLKKHLKVYFREE